MAKSVEAAPPQQQSRRPGPEHRRLSVFVGKWRTEGRTVGDEAPAAPIRSSDVYEWVPGGFFVVHRWDGTVGETAVHGIEIIGYDSNRRTYQTHFFDSDGNAGSEQLSVQDRTWTWVGRQVMGSDWHRCTSVVSDDGNTMQAKHERSNDGELWMPWMDVTLRRVG
jgi:Protein of unknown function (DUF1579)